MKKKKRPVGIDLYCGAGGMSLGFEQAGFDVIAAVDNDPIHVDTHSSNFPDCVTIQADISKLSGKKLRDLAGIGETKIDVLFGGPPCGGFSLIGRRNPDDPRNKLLLSFARMVRELKPKYFVVENVRGLVIGEAKNSLRSFIRRIKLAGYEVVTPIQILTAKSFGVPQERKRILILGYQKGLVSPHYPTQNGNRSYDVTVWDAIGDLPKIENLKYLLNEDIFKGKLKKTASRYAKILRCELSDPEDHSLPRKINGVGISGFKKTVHTEETIKRFKATQPGTTENVSRFYRLSKGGLARTLRAGSNRFHGGYTAPRPIHPVYPRCITVREGARLHSIPDWFEFHPTIWHGFRQIGNSVPPYLARAIAIEIYKIL